MKDWYLRYLGKPWKAAPKPPESFNCGELLRYVYKELGVDSAPIEANPLVLRECINNMQPALFGLRPLTPEEKVKDFDCAFFSRHKYDDHCGIAVSTEDGTLILHCLQGAGVVLENELEAISRGFQKITWYRYRGMN